MEEIIYQYLTDSYYIKKSPIGNDGIYCYDDARHIKVPIDGMNLITELEQIFAISRSKVFNIIYHWAYPIDLSFYWKNNSSTETAYHINKFKAMPKPGHLPKTLHMVYLELEFKNRKKIDN